MDETGYDTVIKIMLIGNSNVGKTAFIHRYCQGVYKGNLPATVGLDYQQRIVEANNKRFLVQLWDTAGQQKFRAITPSFYRSAMAIILCYSVEDRDSFNSIALWIKQIRKYSSEQLPVLIVGNKCDLQRRQVLDKEGRSIAQSYGLDFLEVSAKEDINITAAVQKIMQKVKVKIDKHRVSTLKFTHQSLTQSKSGYLGSSSYKSNINKSTSKKCGYC